MTIRSPQDESLYDLFLSFISIFLIRLIQEIQKDILSPIPISFEFPIFVVLFHESCIHESFKKYLIFTESI